MTLVQNLSEKEPDVNLTQSQAYTNFLDNLNGSEYTKTNYVNWLKKYRKFCQCSYDELLFDNDHKVAENRLIAFLVAERKAGAAPGSLHRYAGAVRRFYEVNDITLNKVKLNMYVGKRPKKSTDIPYTHDQIAQLLSKADDRMRMVILLMAAGGLRRGGITSCSLEHIKQEMNKEKVKDRNFHCLKIGDLTSIKEHDGIYKVHVYSYDSDDSYYTFLTPEASKAVGFYLSYRKNHGEILQNNAPLLRNQFDKRSVESISNPRPITGDGLESLIYNLVYDAGLLTEEDKKTRTGDRHMTKCSHGLRKFTATQMKNSGIDPFYIANILGHSTGLFGTYSKIGGPEDLLPHYIAAVPALTINEEERLRSKVKKLTAEQDRIMAKLNKIDALAEKLGITDDDEE